ncbi:unnamed protein product [Allacma fusca]|uniref:Chaoptin n=1 Tax=Allacma fusca TaxID=39272 RepID=A0A8J2L509_9HEXA|nr:unnamed protein product [Allacma fusca]
MESPQAPGQTGLTRMTMLTVLLLAFLTPDVRGGYVPPEPKYKCPILTQIWPCVCLTGDDFGITLKCEDVSLATLAAALQHPIKEKIPVLSLHVLKLNSEKLYGNLFAGLEVQKIVIEDSPVQKLLPDILYDARNSLKELELLKTQLDEFPYESLKDLNLLVNLTLDGHLITDLSKPIVIPVAKNLRISNGNVSILTKDTFSRLGGLDRLDLHGNQISAIPRDSFKSQGNCRFLDLSYNQMTKLDPVYFPHLTKLTWFNGSHNLFPDFTRGAFARNNFLAVLHLTHNKMTKLDSQALKGMRYLRRLFLSDNQIADVGRGAFGSIRNRIGTIDLARNRLKVIDYQMFHELLQPDVINVAENEITVVKGGAFRDLSYVFINMSHNAISVIEKDAFVNCINITILDMSHNRLENITRGAFDGFTYPTEWRLEYNLLKNAGDIPLKNMTGIKYLNVSHNEIQEIPKTTFPKLYELHTVDFSYNNISKVFAAVFANLFSVRHLNLSHNSMAELGSLGAVPTLLDLQLSHNQIRRVSNSAFTRLASLRELQLAHNNMKSVFQIPPSLTSLNLSNNEITSLSKAWPTMNSLLRLDLSGNELGGNLERGSFQNLATLQAVDLSANNITEIPSEALADLTTVQYINLERNSISNLTKMALGRLPVVFDLLLAHNNISEIAPKAFEGLLQLLRLDLSYNDLSTIPVGAFAGLVSLRKLNLSHNHLQRTENGEKSIFDENLSLETIDLSYNKISEIYYNTFPENRWIPYKIYNINLSHNMLMYIGRDLLRGTKKLKNLDVSFNRITELRSNVVGNMTSLQVLDLRNNEISFLEPEQLGPPPNLTEIYLQKNNLRKFPARILAKAPFKLIDLTDNRMRHFDSDFMPKVKNGSRFILVNNPIACDCRLILLKRFYNDFRPKLSNFSAEFYRDFENLKCGSDQQHVMILREQELKCDYGEDPFAPKIPQNYDLEIRSFAQVGETLEIKWRVRSKMDVTGFRVTVKDSSDQEIFVQVYPYNLRSAKLSLKPESNVACLSPTYSRREANDNALKVCQKIDIRTASNAAIPIFCDVTLLGVVTFLYFIFIF